jgi:predicted dehydrogenase
MDLDEDLALRLSKYCHSPTVFADLNEMLVRGRSDVVHICSPNSTHYPIAESAIKAGCHILIEKPMASTAIQTKRLFDMAADRGVFVCPVHQFLFQDGVLKAKRLLPKIGRLVDICAVIASAGGVGLTDEKRYEAVIADMLPHPLSLMQFFLPGNFSQAEWWTVSPGRGELRAFGKVSGTTLSVFISMNARPTVNSLELKGEKGTIHVNLFHGYSFIESGEVSRRAKLTQPFERSLKSSAAAAVNLGRRLFQSDTAYPGLQSLVKSFYEAIQKDTSPPISQRDTDQVAQVRDELLNLAGLALENQGT